MKKIFFICGLLLAVAMNVNAEIILEEEVVFGNQWDTYRVIPVSEALSLTNVAKGDLLTVTVTAVGDGPQIAIQSSEWKNLDENFGICFSGTGLQRFVLTDSAVTQIKTGGIIVKGVNCTISKVELLYQKTLWTGELDATTNWAQTDVLDNNIFADLEEGDLLGVTVSKINENNDGWHLYAFRADYRTNFISHDMNAAGTGFDVLSAADVDSLQNKTIILVASYLTATAIHTYVPTKSVTPTAIDEISQSQGQSKKFFKDGQLFILRDDKTYTLQGQRIQ